MTQLAMQRRQGKRNSLDHEKVREKKEKGICQKRKEKERNEELQKILIWKMRRPRQNTSTQQTPHTSTPNSASIWFFCDSFKFLSSTHRRAFLWWKLENAKRGISFLIRSPLKWLRDSISSRLPASLVHFLKNPHTSHLPPFKLEVSCVIQKSQLKQVMNRIATKQVRVRWCEQNICIPTSQAPHIIVALLTWESLWSAPCPIWMWCCTMPPVNWAWLDFQWTAFAPFHRFSMGRSRSTITTLAHALQRWTPCWQHSTISAETSFEWNWKRLNIKELKIDNLWLFN